MSEFEAPAVHPLDQFIVERRPGGAVAAWMVRRQRGGQSVMVPLSNYQINLGEGFAAGPGGRPAGCQNLAYSILRQCVEPDVAQEWYHFVAWFAVAGKNGASWTWTVQEVRELIEVARVWYGKGGGEWEEPVTCTRADSTMVGGEDSPPRHQEHEEEHKEEGR